MTTDRGQGQRSENPSELSVCLYTRERMWGEWEQQQLVVLQHLPAVGQYIQFAPQGDWYEVQAVVHLAFAGAEYLGEVYAERVERPVQYKPA